MRILEANMKEPIMKRMLISTSRTTALTSVTLVTMCLLAGCDTLRLAPSEQQKQNAWLHNRTAAVAAETAKAQQSSQELQALTQLSELQSRAFTSYCGLPKEYPPAETTEQILGESNWQLANAAVTESAQRQRALQEAAARPSQGLQSRPAEPIPPNPPTRRGPEGITRSWAEDSADYRGVGWRSQAMACLPVREKTVVAFLGKVGTLDS
jgi:hypothetical protein